MELARPVVVQHHGHLTLTLDFQGQIMKMLYLRNGRADWHGTKGIWIDRMLHPLCDFQCSSHPWPWPWIFKVKFWKSRIWGKGWPIDMELKRCESIECWTHAVTFNVHLTHDLDLGFSRSNCEKVVSGMGWSIDMEQKRCESIDVTPTFILSGLPGKPFKPFLRLLVPAMVRILSAQASQVFGSMPRGAQWSPKVKQGLL